MATTTVTVEQRSVIPSRPEFGSVSLRAEEAGTPPAVGEVDIDSPLVLAPTFLSSLAGRLQSEVDRSEQGETAPSQTEPGQRRHRPTVFHGSKHTPIPVRDYVQRIADHSKCSQVCFVAAYGYLQRLSKVDSKYRVCSRSVHRLLISSVLIAAKLFDDKFYSNAFYARIGGITTKELNRLELEMLQLLEFRMWVRREDLLACAVDLSTEPPCKPQLGNGGEPGVRRKRVNEDPSAESTIPAKLQHSSGKDQILVTPTLAASGVSKAEASPKVSGRGSVCATWEGPAPAASVLQAAVDVGGS